MRRRDGAEEQPDGRGAEGEYRPGHGERINRRGREVESAGFGRAEQAGHAEVDHGGQQPAEREAQRRHQRGEVTAQVGTPGARSGRRCRFGAAGPPGQDHDRDHQRDEQDRLRDQQDGEECGRPGSAPGWRPCCRSVHPLTTAEITSVASAAISRPMHHWSARPPLGVPSGSSPFGLPPWTVVTV